MGFTDLMSRMGFSHLLGLSHLGERDLYQVFGYPKTLKFEDFFARYERQDIASRIVDAPAKATWPRELKATGAEGFEAKWDALVVEHNLHNVFERADRLAGLGRFSCLLLGFDKGALSGPVVKGSNLIYVQPLSEASVDIIEFEDNTADKRFGKPKTYKIAIPDPKDMKLTSGIIQSGIKRKDTVVHWSRIVHIAESVLESDIFGTPRMQQVYNRLMDLEKIVGGSAETFWLTGNRGLHIDIDKDMELAPGDEEALSDEVDEYEHQLRRILRTRGVKVKPLGSEIADPEGNFKVQIALLSSASEIPVRILLGSEAGQLASAQDRANWADRIDERRKDFAEPAVLIPFTAAMVNAGILPEGPVTYTWPSAFKMSPLEESQEMAQKARAAGNMSRQADKGTPILTTNESREVLGFEVITEDKLNEGTLRTDESPTLETEEEPSEDEAEQDREDEDADNPENAQNAQSEAA